MEETEELYYWTEDCDMLVSFTDAWWIWFNPREPCPNNPWKYDCYDDEEYEEDWMVMKVKKSFEKMQPRIKAMKAAVPKKTTPAAVPKHTTLAAVPKSKTPVRKNTAAAKAKISFKSRVEAVAKHGAVMQSDWIPLPPDSHCLKFYEMTEECRWQWEDWNWYCEDNWTPMCSSVYYEWLSQDIDWVIPTRPNDDCAVSPADERMTDVCVAEWQTLWDQCYYLTDPLEPVYWNEDCDMVTAFAEAWAIWF